MNKIKFKYSNQLKRMSRNGRERERERERERGGEREGSEREFDPLSKVQYSYIKRSGAVDKHWSTFRMLA